MGKYNYFAMLGISPTDTKKLTSDEVYRLVQIKMKKINSTLVSSGTSISTSEQTALKEQLALKDEMLRFALSFPKSKEKIATPTELSAEELKEAKKLQAEQAAEFTTQRSALMKSMAEMIFSDNQKTIRKARVQKLANEFGLERATAEKIFTSVGFQVESPVNVGSDLFIPDAKLQNIESLLENLRGQLKKQKASGITGGTAPIPDGLETAQDLYDYLSACTGTPTAELRDPRRTSTRTLAGQFESLASQHTRNGEPHQSFRALEGMGQDFFQTEEGRRRYDNTLRRLPLDKSIFSLAAQLPDSVKADRSFAEMIIARIRRVFSDENTAIAIYNLYCRVPKESYYEKESNDVSIVCKCGHLNHFSDLAVAQRGRCHNCGLELFITCPNCETRIANNIENCICGYYIPGLQSFNSHMDAVKNALTQENLQDADEHFKLALEYKPKKIDLKHVQEQISRLREKMATQLAQLDVAIQRGNLSGAKNLLLQIRKDHPKANLSTYDAKIAKLEQSRKDDIIWAIAQMKAAMAASNANKVQICNSILQRVPDYLPAMDLLNSPLLRPQSVLGVTVVKNSDNRAVSISWQQNPDNIGVTYTVVRKVGTVAPTTVSDGTVVEDGLTAFNLRDGKGLEPGVIYSYSVFAVRGNNVSSAACGKPIVLTPGLPKPPTYRLTDKCCQFSWQDVCGSRGVRIERSSGSSGWSCVKDCAHGSFQDSLKESGTVYNYRFVTIWSVNDNVIFSDNAQQVSVKMISRPQPISFRLTQINKEGKWRISWLTRGDFDLAFYAVDMPQGFNTEVGTTTVGNKPLVVCPVNSGSADLTIAPNQIVTLQCFSRYGTNGLIAGDHKRITTMQEIEPDWENMDITANALSLSVRVPKGYTKLWLLVHEKNGMDPEATSKEALHNGLGFDVSSSVVDVTMENCPEKNLSVILAAETASGRLSQIEYDEYDNRPKGKLTYRITWNNNLIQRKNLTLRVTRTNPENKELPVHVLLCCKPGGGAILESSYKSATMRIITELVVTGNSDSVVVPKEKLIASGVTMGTAVRAFLAPADMRRFASLQPENAMDLRCPWQLK